MPGEIGPMTDADIISELQSGNRLLKQQRYSLLEENERLKRVIKVRDRALKSKRNFELLTGAWL